MINLILFILASIGGTHIVVDGKIMEPVRDFVSARFNSHSYLLNCYSCAGFHVGMLCGSLIFGFSWQLVILYGFIGSFSANFSSLLMNWVEASITSAGSK